MNHLVNGGGVLNVASQSKYVLRMAIVLMVKSASLMLPPNKACSLTFALGAAGVAILEITIILAGFVLIAKDQANVTNASHWVDALKGNYGKVISS